MEDSTPQGSTNPFHRQATQGCQCRRSGGFGGNAWEGTEGQAGEAGKLRQPGGGLGE